MRAEEYLQILSEQIRCKKARDAVKEEVCCHLKDQEEAFKEEGMEKEAAEEAAVKEMGVRWRRAHFWTESTAQGWPGE